MWPKPIALSLVCLSAALYIVAKRCKITCPLLRLCEQLTTNLKIIPEYFTIPAHYARNSMLTLKNSELKYSLHVDVCLFCLFFIRRRCRGRLVFYDERWPQPSVDQWPAFRGHWPRQPGCRAAWSPGRNRMKWDEPLSIKFGIINQ